MYSDYKVQQRFKNSQWSASSPVPFPLMALKSVLQQLAFVNFLELDYYGHFVEAVLVSVVVDGDIYTAGLSSDTFPEINKKKIIVLNEKSLFHLSKIDF